MPDAASRHPESRDVNGLLVAIFGTGLGAFLVIAVLTLMVIYGRPPSPLPFGARTGLEEYPGPVLQTDPRAEKRAYDAEKDNELNGLGWIDRRAGISHIPIERAMRIIAENGVPDWGQRDARATDDCKRLLANVPRAPQAESCHFPSTPGNP